MAEQEPGFPRLFTPLPLRDIQPRNRVVISPMATYAARDGLANDWHLAHYGKFAAGGAGITMVEATAVENRGRITHGCLGLWNDAQTEQCSRLARFIRELGSVPAIQLAHGGRKAAAQRPWHGNGALGEADRERGELSWEIVGPTDEPATPQWRTPQPLHASQIQEVVRAWGEAAKRADQAGFEVLEIHGAHGYLIHSFLSPLSNHRTDEYGGNFSGRTRLAREIVTAVRTNWPSSKPLFFRVSGLDGDDRGWLIEDSIQLARDLASLGVDVIDCSSGGIAAISSPAQKALARRPGFQVPISAAVKQSAGVMTMAVGLILSSEQAEEILRSGQADLIAIGREALYNPNWAVQASQSMGLDPDFSLWPDAYGWWLKRRAKTLEKISGQSA